MPSNAAKTPTKKTTKRASLKSVAPKSVAKSSSPKRETVATLAQNLKSLESRLKGADTKNRNAVKALEKTVSDLKAATKQGSTTHKAALTRGLNKLEIRMETYLKRSAAEARAGVRADLANVTSAGADLSTLETAIEAAHARLDQMDAAQRGALARINRHIADLAISIDNRLSGESQARETATAALDAKIESVRGYVDERIEQVEEETATALETVGAKVAEFAGVLEQRAQTSDAETAERLADLAKETQSGMDAAQSDVAARLEALEVIASAWSPTQAAPMANPYLPANADDPRIDQMGEMIASLQEELSRMHARIATVQHAAPPSNLASIAGAAQAQSPVPSTIVPMAAVPASQIQDNPYAAAAQALENTTAEPPAPQAEMAAPPENKDPRTSHIPQEFDPSAFAPQPETIHGAPVPQAPYPSASLMPPAPQAAQTPTPQPLTPPPLPAPPPIAPPPVALPPLAPPMASAGTHNPAEPAMPPLAAEDPLMPAPAPVSTYADPAYAEEDDMRAERIGVDSLKPRRSAKATLAKLPITGRNLRIGGLAVGVAVVGLFAAKTILGGPESGGIATAPTDVRNASLNNPSEGVSTQTPNFGTADASQSPTGQASSPPPPIAPLGQYAETKPLSLSDGAENTLDAAVEAGNPIAQFQKGLAQLQAGQMEEGARLIRLAANRNQPAAQYRLAKLYESGTGIGKDPITARELIERAARGGNRIAMHDLGNYHAYGQGGLQQDIGAALDWFTKAAERGVVDSQFNVAFLREGNEGIPADIETSLFWYYVAARQGDQGAPDRIAALSAKLDSATAADIKSRADSFNPKPVDEAANGIFRNVAWAKQNTSTAEAISAAKSAEILKIRDAQTLLSELGYQVGTPDGISGAKTRDAVKSFEAVNGLPETGEITDELIDRLEIAAGA